MFRHRWHLHIAFSMAALLFLSVAVDAAEEAKPPVNEEQGRKNLLTMIEDSGPAGIAFLAVLGLFSLAAGTITVERLVNLQRNRIVPKNFLIDLEKRLRRREKRPEKYRQMCQASPSPLAKIFRAALFRAGRPAPEVEKAMEDAMAREVATLRSGVRPLSVIGSVAPLVGLLGTVVGMILAFHTASEEGLGGKAQTLAKGIYLALLTTAAGLSIAIPSMLFAAYFNNRIDRYFRECDEHLMASIPLLAGMTPQEQEMTEEEAAAKSSEWAGAKDKQPMASGTGGR